MPECKGAPTVPVTTERTYRRTRTEEEAPAEVEKGTGTQWNPKVVMVVLKLRRSPTKRKGKEKGSANSSVGESLYPIDLTPKNEYYKVAERSSMPSERVQLEAGFLQTPAASTLQALLGGLLEVAIRATEASEGSIILLDHELELLTMGLAGEPKKTIVRAARRRLGRSISAWVADHKEPLLLVGPAKDPRFSGVERDIKDAVCVPLIVGDRVIGILSVSNRSGSEHFVQRDLESLTALAEPSARAIASALAYMDAEERGYLWERKRLAQEIHDGLIQELTAVFLQLEIYERLKGRDNEKAEEQLGRTKQQVKASLQGLRRLLFDLRAADVGEVSLKHMLERSVSEFERGTEIAATLKVTGQERELSPQTKGNLIAIAEESLANIKKHSGAERVLVHLNYAPGVVELIVTDDGRGFDWQEAIQRAWTEKRFGLMGMQERAHILDGDLEIESIPGGGSTIKARVPVRASEVTDEP